MLLVGIFVAEDDGQSSRCIFRSRLEIQRNLLGQTQRYAQNPESGPLFDNRFTSTPSMRHSTNSMLRPVETRTATGAREENDAASCGRENGRADVLKGKIKG